MRWILFTDRIEMVAENKEDEDLIQRIADGVEVVNFEGVRFEIGEDGEGDECQHLENE